MNNSNVEATQQSNSSPAVHNSDHPRTGNGSRNTATVTITQTSTSTTTNEIEVLPLNLRARPTVTWDENVQDNEGLGRKSSKRCCIFHKPRDFGESSSESGDDSDHSESSSSSGGGFPTHRSRSHKKKNRRRIARPKQGKKVPDHQRYHA